MQALDDVALTRLEAIENQTGVVVLQLTGLDIPAFDDVVLADDHDVAATEIGTERRLFNNQRMLVELAGQPDPDKESREDFGVGVRKDPAHPYRAGGGIDRVLERVDPEFDLYTGLIE